MTGAISAGMRGRRFVCWRALAVAAVSLTLFTVGANAAPGSSLPAPLRALSGSSAAAAESCQPPTGWQSTKATPVPGIPSDYDLTSFDGTTIRIHWFPDPLGPGGRTHPTVLMGPGWGSSGDTDTSQAGIQGALSIAQLWQGGFNVLTWDPRGFGHSGGEAEVDSPNDEGRDVSAMLNWVAQQAGVQLDRPGVPRVGMVGESYGGGVQFAAAERDCRIDAIAPTIAWHSLGTSLDKNQTPKTGWGNILASVSSTAKLDPEITTADNEMNTTGTIDAGAVSFFESRGPAQFLSQGEGADLDFAGHGRRSLHVGRGDRELRGPPSPGDHGLNGVVLWWSWRLPDEPGLGPGGRPALARVDAALRRAATRRRTCSRDSLSSTRTGLHMRLPAIRFPQEPRSWQPVRARSPSRPLADRARRWSPPMRQAANIVDSVALPVTPGPAKNALNITVPLTRAAVLVGPPTLSMTYSGTVAPGTRPTRVFAQLVDPATGIVVNNQITPIPVTLDGKSHRVTIPLESIGYTAKAGASLELQLVATTVAYITPRLGGTITFARVRVDVPTAKGLHVLQGG